MENDCLSSQNRAVIVLAFYVRDTAIKQQIRSTPASKERSPGTPAYGNDRKKSKSNNCENYTSAPKMRLALKYSASRPILQVHSR